MDIVFRKWSTDNGAIPAANELWLLPADNSQRDGRRLAELVLQRGVEALRQGTGPIETIVVQHDPTLDDMLAAELVCRRLQSPDEPWPAGMAAFARYARLVREGHRPTRFDLENTIEAIFLAVRTRAGENLSEPERAAEFLARWRPLADRIVESAATDVDPFRTELFGPGHEFAEERAWLLADREVYRHDVARGQRWLVRIPGGPPQAAALVLIDPKSLSFHRFCRIDPEAPGGSGYALLVVRRQEGVRWIVSTDRAQRISLQGLAQQLQQAEAARDAASAAADPWFDGAPYDHTLIAAPRHGTRLADEQVLRIVRRWAQAQSGAWPGSGLGHVVAKGAIAAALLVAVALVGWRIGITPGKPDSDIAEVDSLRGWRLAVDDAELLAAPGKREGVDRALLIATDEYDSPYWQKLSNPIADAEALARRLQEIYGFEVELLRNPTRSELFTRLTNLNEQKFGKDDQLFIFVAGHGDKRGREGYLVLKDSRTPREDDDRSSYLAHSQFRDIVEKINCAHILVALDVCFGGIFDFGELRSGNQLQEDYASGPYRTVTKSDFVRRKLSRAGRLWLTSGANEPVPDGIEGSHSPFARRMLLAFDSRGGDDGILTFYELWTEVEQVGTSEPRTGPLRLHEPGGDFLFISQAGAAGAD